MKSMSQRALVHLFFIVCSVQPLVAAGAVHASFLPWLLALGTSAMMVSLMFAANLERVTDRSA